jgi:lyso-ornithine lipid O-acyltransferase
MTISYGSHYGTTIRGVYKFALLIGFIALVFLVQPLIVLCSKRLYFRTARFVHATISRILEIQITVRGTPCAEQPVLFVANHTSYLDIPVLGSLITGCFVAKSEVEGWPIMGQMCKMQDTIFIKRKATEAEAQRDVVRERLEQGKNVILFPEGTSTNGIHLLPFKSSLFATVQKPLPNDQPIYIQPVSITAITLDGLPMGRTLRPLYAWYGDMTLGGHGWPMLKLGKMGVLVEFHPAIASTTYPNRKAIAQYCNEQVQGGVVRALAGRCVADASAADAPAALPAPAPSPLIEIPS